MDFTRAIGDTSGGSTNSTAGTSGASGQPIVDLGDRDYTVILKAHGAMMFIAWGVAPFFGIFIARYLKNALGHNWYRLHVFFMLGITGLFTLIGFIIIVLFAPPPHFRTTHAHRPIGLFMFIALFIQIALGFVANHMFDPNRPGVPWWDKAHWWLGRSLFVLGIINVYLGINLFSNYGDINMPLITGLYWAWVVIGFVALLAGNFKIGQKHHMAGNYAAPIDSVESL